MPREVFAEHNRRLGDAHPRGHVDVRRAMGAPDGGHVGCPPDLL